MEKIHVLKCNLQKLFYLIILHGKTNTYYIIQAGKWGEEALEGRSSLLLCTCYLKCERKCRIRTIEDQNFSIFPNLFHFSGWIPNKKIVFPLKLCFEIYIFPELFHSFATPITTVFGWEPFPRTSSLFICFSFRVGAGWDRFGLVHSSVWSLLEFRLCLEWKCESQMPKDLQSWECFSQLSGLPYCRPARHTIAIVERFSHNSETMYKFRRNFPVYFLHRIFWTYKKIEFINPNSNEP